MAKKNKGRFGAISAPKPKMGNPEFLAADRAVMRMHPGPDPDYVTPKPPRETDAQVLARLEKEVVDDFLRHSRSARAVRIELLREAQNRRIAA